MDFKTRKSPLPEMIDTAACITKLASACMTDDAVVMLKPLSKDQNAIFLFGHKGPQIWVYWIESSRKGAGAQALLKLTRAADAENAVLRLYVDDDINGGLFAFYERFGFVRDPAGSPIMERAPALPVGIIKNENFRRWFARSKVTDHDGKPLLVFHGTTSEIQVFKIGDPWGDLEAGAFFSEDPWSAGDYAQKDGGNIVPAFLSIQNPYDTTFEAWDSGDACSIDSVKSAGLHDGYVIRGWSTQGDAWVAFYPNQIKSALGNTGKFDPNNPDLIS